MEDIFNLQTLDSAVRLSVPLLLCCLAGLYSERSGVFDIGLEGKMLAGAFGAAVIGWYTQSAWLGLLAGMGVGIGLSLVHGAASITLKGNQIISGLAINFLAVGLTTLLGQAWFRQGGRTPPLSPGGRFGEVTLPFAGEVSAIPFIGPIYADLISGHNFIAYLAFIMVPVTAFVLFRTRFGLRLRAVGENPTAVDTAGISVVWLRYQALIICGMLSGAAGAYLSIAQGSGFGNNMSAGKGFIALAALIFAKWRPWPAMWTCLLFGLLDAIQIRLQGRELPFIGDVPVQAIQALPYVLTVVLLAGFIGSATGPRAGGVPYTKER